MAADVIRKILISGAEGLIGRSLSEWFASRQAQVVPIRRVPADCPCAPAVAWNPATGWFDPEPMEDADLVIHLAGESVSAGRWTAARKRRIRDSRIQGTRQLVEAMTRLRRPPQKFFCASAVGLYGLSPEREYVETDPAGEGFLPTVAVEWEAAAMAAAQADIPTTLLRFGVVLDPAGGALGKMLPPFRWGLGGRIGDGRQYFPWIAGPEVPPIVEFLSDRSESVSGPINLVAPQPVTNAEFVRTLARCLNRPAWLPLPASVVRLLFGEMGQEMLLSGCRAKPQVLQDEGYRFRYPSLDSCLRAVLENVGT